MLVVMTRILSNVILNFYGYFAIKGLIKDIDTRLTKKNVGTIMIAAVITSLFTLSKYNTITPILAYIILVILYKLIFNLSIYKSIIISGVIVILPILSELTLFPIAFFFFNDMETIRITPILMLIFNIAISAISLYLSRIRVLNTLYSKLMKKLDSAKPERIVVFTILTILVLSTISYIVANIYALTIETIICFSAILVFIFLFILYSREQNEYISLNDQYDKLLEYVKNFEIWIDNVELNKHEYKNDLAVLETKIKDPEIKKFISEKITKKLDIDKDWVTPLRKMPSGGMKGLLYYKIIIAKNKKINLRIDISPSVKKLFLKIKKEHYQVLCRLFGIYLDNALEAAINSKEKSMSVEIYELHKNLNIVISNSFSGKIDMNKVSIKGYSTKGKGHGSGLYFARKIVKQYKNFIAENKICNSFYIQKIVVIKEKKR